MYFLLNLRKAFHNFFCNSQSNLYIFFHFCTLYNVILNDTQSWVTCLFLPINSASQGLAVNNTLDFMTKIKINRQTVPKNWQLCSFFVKCKKHHSSWCKAETVGSALQICTVGIRTQWKTVLFEKQIHYS